MSRSLPTLDASGNRRAISSANPMPVTPSADQDPILDHANGTKTSVTSSATVITPPVGCKYIRITTDVDIVVNTAGNTAVDNGTSSLIIAYASEIIPVTAGVAVKALSLGTAATVRCTPYKVRS